MGTISLDILRVVKKLEGEIRSLRFYNIYGKKLSMAILIKKLLGLLEDHNKEIKK